MESMVQNDPVLGQYVNNPLPPVRAALVSSEGLNTERLARERTLSASLGIPPRLLRPDMDKAEREALAQRIQSDPVLARYAGMSPENAAIVRDDEGGLLGVIHAVGEAGRDIGEAWGAGKRQIELSDMGNRLADGDESALADIDAWHERERTFPERDTLADTLGLTSAVTQLPRMFSRDIPEAVKYAAGGALAGGGSGAIIGSAIPGVGTAGGAAAGLRIGGGAGWALGSGVAAYRAERGNFAAQFSQERDENGNRPDLETLTVSADTYALLSAGIETLGEALFLKLLKPVAGQALGRLGIRGWLYSAVKEAAKDKSALAVMGDITRRVLAGAALEGLEEGSQQLVSILVESTAKRHATRAGVNQFADEGLLPSGAGAEILESAVEGAKAGLWLSGGPTIILGAGEVRKARQTAEWAQKQKMLKSAVDQTKVQTASPELSESFLRRGAGVTGNVSIPADAVLELHQSGMDILEPMGWQAQDVADAAAMGQELEVPLSRLHTRLDNTTFGAVIDVARRTPDSMTAVEAAQINERIQADTEEVNDAFMEYQAEQNTIDAEMERVRSEISGAVGSVPGLASQVRADSTLEETAAADGMTPEKAADYYSRLLLNWAERRQERTGVPIAESLRKVNVRGLVRDESGKLLTPEEYEARLINRELEEAQTPFWNSVWGRLDRESLKRDYPDAVRELTAIYGRGIFARKGQGRALDDLAQEMESFYILPEGGGADALMERLKQGSRPSLRMRQGIKGKSLFQPLNKGVNLDRMISTTFIQRKYPAATLKEKRTAVSKGEKKSVLQAFKKGVRNEDTGWVIGMSGNDFDEHLKSDYASSYLMDQYEAVSALPKLMKKAVLVESHDDSHGRANVKKVHRFYAPLSIDGDTYSVVLTVKEFQNGVLLVDAKSPMKLYHHRLVKKMLPVQRGSVALQESPESDPGSISSYSLRELLENVKDNDGIPYFQSAYHGTPHRFNEFSLDAIGTGEGAQAHGWGLYFAQDKTTGERYKTGLGVNITLDGKSFYDGVRGRLESSTGNRIADDTLLAFNGNIDEAIAELQEDVEYGTPEAVDALEVLKSIKADNRLQVETRGQLFEVDIPDNDVLLDEQKKFSEQPEKVQAAIRSIIERESSRYSWRQEGDDFVVYRDNEEIERYADEDLAQQSVDENNEASKEKFEGITEKTTGKEIYAIFYKAFEHSARQASEALNEAGVKGITYNGGQDGRCFVVFDDKAIKVLDTYYQFLGEQGAANLDRAEEASTRLDNLAVAREMEDAGRDAKTVKLATGWERGADGKWRYEIPDGKIRADAGLGTSTLGELYDAPELYAAYPELLAVDVTFQPMEGIKGSYTGNSIVLSDAYLTHEETKDILSTLVHEIQHIIQRREGFARGGSPAQFAVNEDGLTDIGPMLMQNRLARARSLMDSADAGLREKMRAMNRAMLEKDFERLAALEDSLTDEENEVWDSYWWMTSEARTIRDEGRLVTPQEAYEAIQGEAEARNVQKRIDMSKEERLASLAAETEDVAREDQIFLRGTLANESREAASQPRASITPVGDEYLIQLYKGADLSSLLHETGHMFLFEMEQDIRAGLADESLRADYDTLQAWLGALDDDAALKAEYDRSMKQTVAAYGKREFDALPDWMKEDARNRAKQEMFARGFEQYLREGKAPARSLESAFTRFRKWLLNIYRKALQLNVELTDDVRGVFDRLLATDAEMNARAVENGLVDLTARELDALGLKGADRIAVSGLMKSAVDAAAERMRADRDRRRDEQLKAWTREAKTEVESLPVYAARRDMQKTGLDKDAVRRNYGDRLVGEVLHALPGSLRNKGGADPELFALEHGFEDAGSMLLAVRDAARKGDMMRELIHRKQAEWDAGFHAEDYLLDTEEVAKQIELVGRYAREALEKTVVGKERPPRMAEQSVLARVVSEKLAGMEMGRAMRTNIFRMAMRRALAAERRAIVAGDWQAVLDANFQARINMEFARQSLELTRGAERLQERIKSFTGMKRADADARFLVGALAQRHGMGRLDPRLVTEERRNPVDVLQTWLKGAEEDGYPLFLENAFAGSDLFWKDMSVNDFRDVANGIGQIMTVERNRRKLLTARNKADLDAVAKEIGESVAAFRKASPVKTVEKENPALKTLKGIHAVHTKIEALCLALDGGKPGPMWEYVYRPITAAEDNQSVRFRGARDALQKLFFNAYSRKELFAMRRNREYVESVGEKLTRENMIALALNMGNETNIKRVREGHKWTDAQIRDVLARLTRKDWEFVQGVWDYLETFRDESFRLQEDITGMRPQAVEATPLTVTTADGETMTLRGGYYPIKYNSEKGFMAFQREQKEMDREFFGGNSYSAAQTRQGHLKDRARKGTEEPLLLELSVVTDHVFNVIHDLSYRRAVLDVAKVIKHPVVRDAVRGAVGMEMYGELKPWLMDVANERQEPMHAVHRMANWARASSSVMQMGWKVTTMLAQPLGLLQTADVIGYRDTAAGLKKVYSNPLRLPELLDETFARSPMMAERMRSFDREIRDMTKKLMPSSGLFGWVDKIRDSAFLPIGVIQMGVDLPTWWGGYIRGLREFHGDETRAAEYADSIVRMSQGSGGTKDLARVQRGGPLLRLATMFYSYFNTFYNLAARRFTELRLDRSPAAVFRAANTALLLWFLPSVLGELVAGRGPDDDEEWDEWIGMQILQYPFQAVVGVRDLASGIFGEYGYQITPAESAPASLVKWFKAVNRALEEEDAGGLAKPTAEAAGYLFSLPMKQPIITVGNIWDYVTGEDPDFYVRDLLFVKPKDRR